MKLRKKLLLLVFLVSACLLSGCAALDKYTTPHYTVFLFDVSGSMAGLKIEEAREAVQLHIRDLSPREQAGLRVFGQEGCDQTTQLAAVGGSDQAGLAREVEALQADGPTPLALGLRQAGQDLASFEDGDRHIVVFTDGGETCAGDPCAEARRLGEVGIVVDIIAFNPEDDAFLSQAECVTGATDGIYLNITNPEDLSVLLDNLIGPICRPVYVVIASLIVLGLCIVLIFLANSLT